MRKRLLSKAAAILAGIILAAQLCGCSVPVQNVISGEESLSSAEEISEESRDEEPLPEPEPEPEPPKITLSSNEVERGSFMLVRIDNYEGEAIEYKDFLGYDRSFFEYEGGWLSLIPVKTAAKAGNYSLTVVLDGVIYENYITVTDREFEEQYLTVSPSTLEETLESDYARAQFTEKAEPMKKTFTPKKLWNGEFILPLEASYKVSTSFGTFRTFSNGSTEWHNAVDMATKGGTPVYATNSGNVIFAEYLQLTGNTVIIDHGMGVLSWHYHMRSIDVAEGDFVEKGVKIGEVGTTGLSTGNHLHFGMTVGGIFTDPMKVVGTEPQIDFWKAEA